MLYTLTNDFRRADTATLGTIHVDCWLGSVFDQALRSQFNVEEWFALETCNRREIYLISPSPIDEEELCRWSNAFFDLTDAHAGFQCHQGIGAARHLFEVTASLASRALGEPEIVNQVKKQAASACKGGVLGRRLGLLISAALRTGKRVRGETRIGGQVISPQSLISRRVKQGLEETGGRRLVFVGAGDYIRGLLPHFGVQHHLEYLFVNRSPNDLHQRYGGRHMDLAQFLADPPAFDGMVSATSARSTLFSQAWLQARIGARPLILFDGATPPDLTCEAGDRPMLRLLTPADLDQDLARNRLERRSEIPKAYRIIEEELEQYQKRDAELAYSDVFGQIGAYYRDLPGQLAARYLPQDRTEPISRDQVEALFHVLSKRLAAVPILGLRGIGRNFGAQGVAAAVKAIQDGSGLFDPSLKLSQTFPTATIEPQNQKIDNDTLTTLVGN